jgi:hypothetical protein
MVTHDTVWLRNGLMGGEMCFAINRIERISCSTNTKVPDGAVHLSLLKDMEKHNVCIQLKEETPVLRAFGFTRKATAILLHVDGPQTFVHCVEQAMHQYQQ